MRVDRLHKLLLAYYRILQANRELADELCWPLHYLSRVMWTNDVDAGARLLAIQCYGQQSEMGEAERLVIEGEAVGPPCEKDCWIDCGSEVRVDGWTLPLVEATRVQNARRDIANDQQCFYSADETISPSQLRYKSFSCDIAHPNNLVALIRPMCMAYCLSVTLVTTNLNQTSSQLKRRSDHCKRSPFTCLSEFLCYLPHRRLAVNHSSYPT